MQSLRPPVQMQPPRHSLVWLTPAGWDQVQAGAAQALVPVRDAIGRWHAADWPLVVCRAVPAMLPGRIALGIALPPDEFGNKPRISTTIELTEIRHQTPPLSLQAVLQNAPPHWRAGLLALQLQAAELSLELRVFGSLAWQTLTGMPYLRASSDIDLLMVPASSSALSAGLVLLTLHAGVLPLDGEIVFPSGAAVAWKEWRGVAAAAGVDGSGSVLVKHGDRVSLASCASLLTALDTAPCSR